MWYHRSKTDQHSCTSIVIFCHEVTSPQAFNGLRARGLKVFRPELTTMTADHNTPTINQDQPVQDSISQESVRYIC